MYNHIRMNKLQLRCNKLSIFEKINLKNECFVYFVHISSDNVPEEENKIFNFIYILFM